MFGLGVRYPENATLLGGADYKCHIKSQPFEVAVTKPSSPNGRLAKWAILLSQYEMRFQPQKAVKGQAVADFLAEHPDPGATKFYEVLPVEVAEVCTTQTYFERQVWQLFFDRASRTGPQGHVIAGVGIVLVSPQNYVIPRAFSLTEPYSNNIAEYNALLIGML